jgi:hypothetical protein
LLVQTFDRSPDLIDVAMRNYVMSFESSGIDAGTQELIERLRPILAAPIADHLGPAEDCWTEDRLPMMAAFARIFQRYHVEDSEPVLPSLALTRPVSARYNSAA